MKIKKVLSLLVLVGFAILGVFFLKGRTHELAKMLEIDLRYLLILFPLVILSSLFRGHKLKLLMELYGIKLGFKEWYGLQLITQFWNFLTPLDLGGISVRAVYFKKKYMFPYISSASTLGISYVIDFLIFGLSGIMFTILLPVQNEIKYGLLIVFTIVSLGSFFVLFFMPQLPVNFSIKVVKYVINSINDLQRIRKEALLIAKLSLNCICRVLVSAVQLYFMFLAFDFKISFYTATVITVFTALATVISITPMNLGFKESIVIMLAKLFGIGAFLGVFVAVVDRAITMIWVFISTPFFSYILSKEFKIKDNGLIKESNQKLK